MSRTRRLLKPIDKGNNQHGRLGKRRCLQCRAWKRKVSKPPEVFLTCKCEYVHIADPCKGCRERGLRCTATDKVWGKARQLQQDVADRRPPSVQIAPVRTSNKEDCIEEIPRPTHTPDEDALGPVDEFFLQFYKTSYNVWISQGKGNKPGHAWVATSFSRSGTFRHVVFQMFGPTLPSLAVRYAVLLFSLEKHAYLYHHDNALLKMDYNNRFLQAMREAISKRRYNEILYASYFACLTKAIAHCYRPTSSLLNDFITHLNGFISILIRAAPVCPPTELLSAHILLSNALHCMWHVKLTSLAESEGWWEDICLSFDTAYLALKSAGRHAPQNVAAECELNLNLITRNLIWLKNNSKKTSTLLCGARLSIC